MKDEFSVVFFFKILFHKNLLVFKVELKIIPSIYQCGLDLDLYWMPRVCGFFWDLVSHLVQFVFH